ncbi:uncharacterized protein BDZ99DRAFT_39565 [Mytilinidion resinicola]|uniref:Uncharacterized protein n=1 Tax=Mytilinidion resinicola TaxID=574789 RepID=A0A6A6YLB8_9PEZI|nr:uncharacterized protein BDZ99DRAFT_39565 [Mytilinidion resinicola]KAF2808775.1 hypothetical protein BDZ99DRAFT_39565 [Mytilinidion resinicola]
MREPSVTIVKSWFPMFSRVVDPSPLTHPNVSGYVSVERYASHDSARFRATSPVPRNAACPNVDRRCCALFQRQCCFRHLMRHAMRYLCDKIHGREQSASSKHRLLILYPKTVQTRACTCTFSRCRVPTGRLRCSGGSPAVFSTQPPPLPASSMHQSRELTPSRIISPAEYSHLL